jgi:hypothetical protein
METAISKTQKRAVKLLNLQAGDTYESAKLALETAGFRGDATPNDKTWRDAAKMTDEQFVAALKNSMLPTNEEIADSTIDRY